MKTPTLGRIVLFAALSNVPAQSFVAATGIAVGDAVIQPTPYPGGFRSAHIIGVVGDGKAGRVSLIVYKQPGDPFRDGNDALLQRLGDVPYSAKGVPGTWMYQDDLDALAGHVAGMAAADAHVPTAAELTALSKDALFAHAALRDIPLGGVTTLRDALPIVAKHHGVTL